MQIAISINQKRKSMKKFFMMALAVLLVAFLSSSFTNHKTVLDNDVGYSITIDQNITVVTMPTISVPVISGEYFILLDRGVSVPYKGLINQDAITYNNKNQFSMCRIDNYSHTWQRSVNTNLAFPDNRINQYSQGVFRLDIGETLLS